MTTSRDGEREPALCQEPQPAQEPQPGQEPQCCHACDAPIEGEPAGRGFLLFARGDVPKIERPPLCTRCAHAIGITALLRFWAEEDEG